MSEYTVILRYTRERVGCEYFMRVLRFLMSIILSPISEVCFIRVRDDDYLRVCIGTTEV